VVTGGGIPDMPGELKDGCLGAADDLDRLARNAGGGCTRRDLRTLLPHPAPFDTEEEVMARRQRHRLRPGHLDLHQDLRARHRVAAAWKSAWCWVNSWFLRDLRTPFGGAKQSGIGREGGVHSLEFYTELKNVCIKL
jgi:aminomuconate-semialdehyde/2-hydroxymuconate-6-semialdehyde dehydrogenase